MSKKISELDLITTPADNDTFVGVQAGENYEYLTSQILRSPVDIHNVMHYGATGDGMTDDTSAIQSAIDAASVSGGMVFFPPGTYLLASSQTQAGVTWNLSIVADKVHLVGYGAKLKTAVASARMLFIAGSGKPSGATSWDSNRYYDATVYTIDAAIRGATTITTSLAGDAGNFSAGDHIFIRTGQTLAARLTEPDAEINKVMSADPVTGNIVLERPTAKAYQQEYFIAGTTGITSTDVTANAAILGVSNVTDRTLIDTQIIGLEFESTSGAYTIAGEQGDGLVIRDCKSVGTGLQSMSNYRDGRIVNNRSHSTGAGVWRWGLDAATGCSDVLFRNNIITGERVVYIHVHEGCSRVKVTNNWIMGTASANDENAISIRARAYDIQVKGNTIQNAGNGAAIYVDQYCVGGGIIEGNTVQGDNFEAAIAIVPTGWSLGDNNILDGNISMYASVQAQMERLACYVEKTAGTVHKSQNPPMGVLPAYSHVVSVRIHVTEAFDSDGADTISVGYDANSDAFATATDVSGTGIKSPIMGTLEGYNATARAVEAYYVNAGSEPTTGKASVILEFYRVPRHN